MLVEIFLKFLICIVYIELFKVINLREETIKKVLLVLSLLYVKVKGGEICRKKLSVFVTKVLLKISQ